MKVPYLVPAPLLPWIVQAQARIKGSSCSMRDDVGRASKTEGPGPLPAASAWEAGWDAGCLGCREPARIPWLR